MAFVQTIEAVYFRNASKAVEIGYYENTTTSSQIIESITCYVGVGKTNAPYTWGDDVTGTGKPLSFYVRCAGVDSSKVTVSNQVSSVLGSGGYYPVKSECKAVKVTFSGVTVAAKSKVYFTLPWLVGNTTNVFIYNNNINAVVSTTTASYTITYHANGGANAPASQTKNHGAALTLRTAVPTGPSLTLTLNPDGGTVSPTSMKFNRGFKNWNTKQNGSGTSYSAGGSFTANANTTLYAQWGKATVLNPPTPTRSGYQFKGWFNATGTQIVTGSSISSNTTATAKWGANTYTVSYNANGGTGAPASQTKYHGTALTLTKAKPTRSITVTYNANGGTVSPKSKSLTTPFSKWNTLADGSGTSHSAGGTYTDNKSATLYAQWSAQKVGTLPTPTRADCKFVGWYTATDGGSKVTTTKTYKNNATIYARWDYTIKYDLNGGSLGDDVSGTIPNATKKHQVALTLTKLTPTKSGKQFLGWSTSKTATSATYTSGSKYTKDEPAVLYAVYGVQKYSVKFDLVGGSYRGGGALEQQVEHGKDATLPNDPVKADSKFVGWLGDYTGVTSNRTIKAIWAHCPVWIMTQTSSGKKWKNYLDT